MRALISLCLALLTGSLNVSAAWQNGAVATVHPLATDAGVNAAKRGGNAVDAAVAAALTLGVVDGHNSGLGGGCFLLIRTERGSIITIDGRETAPARATRDMFVREGKANPDLSQTGALAIGVPGSLAAYEYALRHFGRLKLRDLLLPAADLAERGFPIDDAYARRLASVAREMERFPATASIYLNAEGKPLREGDWLKQPDLARSYRQIADQGSDWFYKTEFPARTEQWMRETGGLIRASDFQGYSIVLREPIRIRYRGHEILGFPPPSSGGVHVAQILLILENFDLRKYAPFSADSVHLIAEAMKLAFADRAFWLGDPDFVKVPRGLVSRAYADSLAKRIDPSKAVDVPSHGNAGQFSTSFFGKHTTHFSTADKEGNWVACTATVNTTFGSKVVIPGTGIVMNNQMDDFSAQAGVPNAFGLVGADANAVAPRKRPLSSMSPTLVLKNGRPILSLGAAGGPTIISQTVVNLVNILDYDMDAGAALAKPRLHHQWKPNELRVEALPSAVLESLRERGQEVVVANSIGVSQIVARGTNGFGAFADPRVSGKGAGW